MQTYQILAVLTVIAIILYLFLRKRKTPKKRPKRGDVVSMYKGFIVTWYGRKNHFPEVRPENAMKIVWGVAKVHADGYIESLPQSFRFTYYLGEMQRKFNPITDRDLLEHYKNMQGGKPLAFADGTYQFMQTFFGYPAVGGK